MNNTEAAQRYFDMKRAEWRAKHQFQLEMPAAEVFKLIDEVIHLYPLSPEERKQRSTHVDVEFVL